jgi:Uma2 family endonuclease
MSQRRSTHPQSGPFRAGQLRSGDPYELDDGHPIECLPGGGRHSRANVSGGLALGTDPAVESAGFDTGYAPDDKNLRAPDLAVGNVPDAPGWVPGAPPLAVEYADVGQDEADLQSKIETLLAAGTRYVWVVRLTGVRRVEVYAPRVPHYLAYPGQSLEAPGVLQNPVPVEALYDPEAAHEAALRNLLQRRGFASLEAVREVGREEGEVALVLRLIERRLGAVPEVDLAAVRALGSDRLTALAEAVGGLATPADLALWLGSAAG